MNVLPGNCVICLEEDDDDDIIQLCEEGLYLTPQGTRQYHGVCRNCFPRYMRTNPLTCATCRVPYRGRFAHNRATLQAPPAPALPSVMGAMDSRNDDILATGSIVLLFTNQNSNESGYVGMGIVLAYMGTQGAPGPENGVYNISIPRRENMQERQVGYATYPRNLSSQMQAARSQFVLAELTMPSFNDRHDAVPRRRGLDFVAVRPGQGLTIDMSAMQLAEGYAGNQGYVFPASRTASDPPATMALQHGNGGNALGRGRRVATVVRVPQTQEQTMHIFGFEVEVPRLVREGGGVDRFTLLPPCFQDLIWYGPPKMRVGQRVKVYRMRGRRIKTQELQLLQPQIRQRLPPSHTGEAWADSLPRLSERNGDEGTIVQDLRRFDLEDYGPQGSSYWVELDDGTIEPVRQNEAAPCAVPVPVQFTINQYGFYF